MHTEDLFGDENSDWQKEWHGMPEFVQENLQEIHSITVHFFGRSFFASFSKFFLFEQNDEFTRVQFKNLVVPFLKTIQARRGITDFKVVCDETNNTGEVIDRNEFVADIFIKPTRSVNFISLNFVATKTGVNFSEVGG